MVESVVVDKELILKLIDAALDAAHDAGGEDVAEMEGVSHTGRGSNVEAIRAELTRDALLAALGLGPKTVPVTDGPGGSVVGSAVIGEDRMATVTLDDSPASQAIIDKITGPHHGNPGFGISSKGTKK